MRHQEAWEFAESFSSSPRQKRITNVEVYGWTGTNSYFALCSDRSVAMGGGGSFGFLVEEDFSRGTSGTSGDAQQPSTSIITGFRGRELRMLGVYDVYDCRGVVAGVAYSCEACREGPGAAAAVTFAVACRVLAGVACGTPGGPAFRRRRDVHERHRRRRLLSPRTDTDAPAPSTRRRSMMARRVACGVDDANSTSLVVTKNGELKRSWSWSSEFRREAVRRGKLQHQQLQEALLAIKTSGPSTNSPAYNVRGSACQQTCQSTQSSFLHLWFRYKASAKHDTENPALRRKAGSAPYSFIAHNDTKGANTRSGQ